MVDAVDCLNEVMDRLEAMEREQKKSNSRIIRAALVASITAQAAQFMILVNSTTWLAALAVVILIALSSWAISRVVPAEGRREWPAEELSDYDPYELKR